MTQHRNSTEVDVIEWVKKEDLPEASCKIMNVAGEVLFEGSLEVLRTELGTGFALGRPLIGIHPVYLLGTRMVTTLQELVDWADWAPENQTFTCTVVFQKGPCCDRRDILNYRMFYKANGLVRAYSTKKHSFEYARKDTIPDSWNSDYENKWVPSWKISYPQYNNCNNYNMLLYNFVYKF